MGTPSHDDMREEIKSVQRVFKLVPHYGKTNALMQQKIHSAQSIAATGEQQFVNDIAPKAGISKTEARQIFQRAERTTTAAMLIVGELQDTMRTMDIAAIETSGLALKLQKVAADFPNLKTLFKLTDMCACEHCRSVYSPAAYLVEVLQFLDKRKTAGISAKQTLFTRRPDLGDIDLSCENANTPLPYIDLVCELMEAEVSPDAGITYVGVLSGGLDPLAGTISSNLFNSLKNKMPVTDKAQIFKTEIKTGSSVSLPHYLRDKKVVCKIVQNSPNNYTIFRLRQTLSTAEELAAAPEYINEGAYIKLSNTEFAFKLPFDLNHTEAKAYFDRFGLKRADLMQDFQVANLPEDKTIAAARLGLTDNERVLIVTSDAVNQKKYWNTVSVQASDEMKIVDTFLTKTRLSYKQLTLLLSLKSIEQNSHYFIEHHFDDPSVLKPTISCDTTKKEIANLDDIALDRIHRFLRLQKKTGWKFETLDEIIYQSRLGSHLLDDNCLIHASNLLLISEKTGIPIGEIIGFYHDIPFVKYTASDEEPLYQQIFLNKAKNGAIDPKFLTDNLSGMDLLNSLKTSLSVCLQESEQELAKLISPTDTLTFDRLSYLFAATRLMRKLKLKADDFIALSELTGIDIQNSPADTLAFVDAAAAAKLSPLPLTEVKFMLWHKVSNLTDREIKSEKIESILKKLQAEYQKAFIANKSPFNENLKPDEQKENLQKLLSGLSNVEEATVTTILKFIDRDWTLAADAKAVVNSKLALKYSTSEILGINNSIDALETVHGADAEKNLLLNVFLGIMDASYIITTQPIEEKKLKLQNLLSGFSHSVASVTTMLTTEEIRIIIKFIEFDRSLTDIKRVVNAKLAAKYNLTDILSINNSINNLEAAHGAETQKHTLLNVFLGIMDASYIITTQTIEEKKLKLQNLLSGFSHSVASVTTMLTTEEIRGIIKFIDFGDAQGFVNGKLGDLFDTSSINTSIAVLWAAAVADVDDKRNALIKAFLDAISAYLYLNEKQKIVEQILTTTLKGDVNLVKTVLKYAKLKQLPSGHELLSDLLISDSLIDIINATPILPAITEGVVGGSGFAKQYQSLRLLHKMIPFIAAFKLDTPSVSWHFENNKNLILDWFLWDEIPYQSGQTQVTYNRFVAFVEMVDRSKSLTSVPNPADVENPITFFSVIELMLSSATTRFGFIEKFALLTGFEKTDVDAIDAYLFPTWDLTHYKDAENWQKVEICLDYLRKLGCTTARVIDFIKPILTNAEAKTLRAALKSRYDEDTWLGTLKEIMDAIRPQKRDALIAYLLAVNPDFKNENDLYDYFLVDVEMEACMPSSRIVQAHGTVQLFVQRCLMGLEPNVIADIEKDTKWAQWSWMKNYRVWEANRKVFLYPENWIEAELRDDKSFLFTELENEIQQNELTNFTAEEALKKYLEKLDNIAFLEVMATWYETDSKTMHVFARTKGGDPAIYFYRRFEQERYWTPWEKVELDITSDHLLAFVRNHRLTLVWLVFSEEPDANQKAKVPSQDQQGGEVDTEKPKRRLKTQLAMSEYVNSKWQPKKVSKEGILTPNDSTTNEALLQRDKYNLMYVEATEQVHLFYTQLSTYSSPKEEYWEQVETHTLSGIFNLIGCKGYPELFLGSPPQLDDFLPDFKNTDLKSQRYNERFYFPRDGSILPNDLAVRNIASPSSFMPILNSTPGKFRLTYPHQITLLDLISPLFQLMISQVASRSTVARQPKISRGFLLPYFMEDSNHAYAVIPGFYKNDTNASGTNVILIKKTASDAFQLIDDIKAWYTRYYTPPTMTPDEWQAWLAEYKRIVAEIQIYRNTPYGEQFKNLYHPLVCSLRTTLYRDGIPALMKRETQQRQTPFNFKNHYQPTLKVPSQYPYPIEDVDFSSDGSYSSYNWELFFHIPFLMATRLTKEQRFEEAMTWFHYIFNPTGALSGTIPQKYWVTKPFFEYQNADYLSQRIDNLLYNLSNPITDPQLKSDLEFAINQWRIKPFRPHVVARFRTVAYQKAVLMKYVDNLMEWGDYLFRQDTMENIVQATQMYILSDKLLGEKPHTIPPVVKPPYETYNQVAAKLDAFGNALIGLENILPDLSALPGGGAELPAGPITLSMLYFCIPQNDKILAYWDKVADRLFKIRHCQNIEGVERSLALFAPPIDPGMLVRAAASGLDISSVLAGINAPTPYYRFNVLSQKATELANEVRGLGSSLLQVLEKKDAEAMSLLRSELEIKVLNAVRDMKKLQIKESKEQIEVLKRTKRVTEERQNYYANIEKINSKEQLNLDKLGEAHGLQLSSQVVRTLGGLLALLPEVDLGVSGFGGTPTGKVKWGGANLSRAANAAADVLNIISSVASYEASRASILGSYQRRDEEWRFQGRLANLELNSIDKQIVAAEIRAEIAETDLKNHDLQIENAKKTDEFMRTKYTNKELYEWMIGQISSVYFRSYQLAHDFAKKAERSYRFELGNDDTFISFGYWDSMKKGLQSADHLIHDIKRMEAKYLDNNKREYEVTKYISLVSLDPLALIKLRATGSCDFDIPEVLFDMDYAGQYFRRIKSVSLSLPCIVGPYTSVSAKLSLIKNKYRKNTEGGTDYLETTNDPRFVYNIGAIQSIATSNAQNDSGVFELNFRDERYLPFEGTGAISSWRLELPNKGKKLNQFNYDTISDVVVHIKYTAREGGSTLKKDAEDNVVNQLNLIKQGLPETGLHLVINMKHDMPNEWHLLKNEGEVNLKIDKNRFPFMAQMLVINTVSNLVPIEKILFLVKKSDTPLLSLAVENMSINTPVNLSAISDWGLDKGEYLNPNTNPINIDGVFKIRISDKAKLEELVMIVKYKL